VTEAEKAKYLAMTEAESDELDQEGQAKWCLARGLCPDCGAGLSKRDGRCPNCYEDRDAAARTVREADFRASMRAEGARERLSTRTRRHW
jgi:predicted amidophosphoribosyltransferase